MSEVLVVVEHAGGAVKKVTLEMLTLARGLGTPAAVVFGAAGTAAGLTDKLGEFGAEKIYVAEGDDVDGYLVAPKAAVLAKLIGEVVAGRRPARLHPGGQGDRRPGRGQARQRPAHRRARRSTPTVPRRRRSSPAPRSSSRRSPAACRSSPSGPNSLTPTPAAATPAVSGDRRDASTTRPSSSRSCPARPSRRAPARS